MMRTFWHRGKDVPDFHPPAAAAATGPDAARPAAAVASGISARDLSFGGKFTASITVLSVSPRAAAEHSHRLIRDAIENTPDVTQHDVKNTRGW